MTLVGYSISKEDNYTKAFTAIGLANRCPGCLSVVDKWNASLDGLRISNRKYDLSTTYDGVAIASKPFRDFVLRRGITGASFRRLPNDRAFYQLLASRTVRFDAVRRQTVFEELCPVCHRYRAVAGATPAFLVVGENVGDMELVRTDAEFGTGDEQGPLLICGHGAGELLRNSGLTGFYLKEVRQ